MKGKNTRVDNKISCFVRQRKKYNKGDTKAKGEIKMSDKENKRRTHGLKIGCEYLENILLGRKTFEIRRNDRDYQVGDYIKFYMIEESCQAVHDDNTFKIKYIHSGLGLQDGYVALAIEKLKKRSSR